MNADMKGKRYMFYLTVTIVQYPQIYLYLFSFPQNTADHYGVAEVGN